MDIDRLADRNGATRLASPPATGSALGRDPFDDLTDPDPFEARLDQLEARRDRAPNRRGIRPPTPADYRASLSVLLDGAAAEQATVSAAEQATVSAAEQATVSESIHERESDPEEERRPGGGKLARLTHRRWSNIPSLGEIELAEPQGLADRLLGENERRIMAAFAHLVEGENAYDRFGFSPNTTKNAFPFFQALYKAYFRVKSEGHENIPAEGPVTLAANHGGLLPLDGAMAVVDVALHTNPPRLARAIVDRWAGGLPWINIFFARMGQVVGTQENFTNLLDDGQMVLVFPEGIDGIRKTITQRYRLQKFRVGFIEQALRARAPIIPTALIGSDDQMPILFDIKPLARWLGLPVAPITLTFPWLGPLGLLPYPVSYRIVYGEPLNYHERFGPEGADDARLVRYLANQVRRRVQLLIDRSR